MLKLYENIRLYRKRAKLTQEELALKTGYTDRSSIARVEKGEIDLPQSKIVQFAAALGVTPGQLMGWDQEEPQDLQDMGALAAQVIMEPTTMEMVRDYMRLNETDQSTVRALVASLAAKTKKD